MMRGIFLLLMSILPLAASANGKVIYIAADIHVMDSSLVVSEGEALSLSLACNRKMLRESIEALEALVDSAVIHRAEALLICGDLTKDGERVSHERVARTLERARRAGIRTFVIPGDHDIDNHQACYYDGDRTYPAASVTCDEFAAIYRHFGYSNTAVRDLHSLSYVCEPVPGLVLLCIDASSLTPYPSPTLNFLLTQADQAKARGKQVVGMMHQPLMEHADGINDIMGNIAIENGLDLASQLAEYGIHLVFTGHTHYSDAATTWNADRTSPLTDVTTGSTITWPSYYRVVTLSSDCSCMTIDTHRMFSLPSQPDYQGYGRQWVENNMRSILLSLVSQRWETIDYYLKKYSKDINLGIATVTFRMPQSPDELVDLVYRHLERFIIRGWTTLHEGNEPTHNAYGELYQELKRGVYGILGEIIENDVSVLGRPMGRRKARDIIMEWLTPMLRSFFEDLTNVETDHEDRTDDLHLNLDLETGLKLSDAEFAYRVEHAEPLFAIRTMNGYIRVDGAQDISIYNLQGQIVSHSSEAFVPTGCYIVHADGQIKKIWVR